MSKKRSVEAILALFALALLIQTIPALGATQVDINYDTYNGQVTVSFLAGDDAETYFDTAGSHIWGEFHAKDFDDNPYNYQVDTFETWAQAEIEGGGYIEWQTDRTDSWTSMYGDAGQVSYTLIDTDDYGFVKFKTNTNYARLRDCEYGFQNDNQFQASGSYYFMVHQLTDSDGEGMYVLLTGDGSGQITVMNGESWGSSWKFGKGCGCYTNGKASATGSGYFEASGWASNYLDSNLGFNLPNGGSFYLGIDYNDGLTVDDFSSEGN